MCILKEFYITQIEKMAMRVSDAFEKLAALYGRPGIEFPMTVAEFAAAWAASDLIKEYITALKQLESD